MEYYIEYYISLSKYKRYSNIYNAYKVNLNFNPKIV